MFLKELFCVHANVSERVQNAKEWFCHMQLAYM